jgi:polyhydroxyalkanoate synthesis regulator phasin
MDNSATLPGNVGLQNGQPISILNELALGTHTFTVNAADNIGNSGATSVTFSVIVTAQSIQDDIQQFVAAGKITQNNGTSFLSKLVSAANARARGNCQTSANIYLAFINEVRAQTGKNVDPAAAAILIGDAQYLIAHCP